MDSGLRFGSPSGRFVGIFGDLFPVLFRDGPWSTFRQMLDRILGGLGSHFCDFGFRVLCGPAVAKPYSG